MVRTGSSSTVGSVRLRLPAVRVREDPASSTAEPEAAGPGGSGPVHGEADAAGPGAGSVRDEIEQKSPPPLSIPPAVTTGLLALRRFYRRTAEEGERLAERWWWLPGRAFGVLTMAPALLAVALLVPGTAMLLAGRLLPLPVLIIFVPLAVALCYFGMRGLPVQWPQFGRLEVAPDAAPADGPDADGRRVGVPVGALLATIAIAAGFGVWQAAFRSEQLFSVGDPSVYLQYGYWIAEHGAPRVPTSAASVRGPGGGGRRSGRWSSRSRCPRSTCQGHRSPSPWSRCCCSAGCACSSTRSACSAAGWRWPGWAGWRSG